MSDPRIPISEVSCLAIYDDTMLPVMFRDFWIIWSKHGLHNKCKCRSTVQGKMLHIGKDFIYNLQHTRSVTMTHLRTQSRGVTPQRAPSVLGEKYCTLKRTVSHIEDKRQAAV
ncbi:hypothetical protein GDO86_010596 [Hymenochirus boettgeri]|uniref:Uncharacterized protein n=1 Tax=Hymenochirus boettgeri TaxID=247094 RepID=A0A8T2JQY8_9PIPI|nr:hypothetical protein GDO86_010596 [Hymenochirus boettgeri]